MQGFFEPYDLLVNNQNEPPCRIFHFCQLLHHNPIAPLVELVVHIHLILPILNCVLHFRIGNLLHRFQGLLLLFLWLHVFLNELHNLFELN